MPIESPYVLELEKKIQRVSKKYQQKLCYLSRGNKSKKKEFYYELCSRTRNCRNQIYTYFYLCECTIESIKQHGLK